MLQMYTQREMDTRSNLCADDVCSYTANNLGNWRIWDCVGARSAGERHVNSQPWAARRGESNARGLALIPVNSTGALAHGPRTLGSMLSGCPRNGPPVRFRCPAQVQVGSGCTAGRCVLRADGLGPGSLMRTLQPP